MDQLPRLGKRELICLLLFTYNYVVSVWRGFLFLWLLGMGYVNLLGHSLNLHIIILTDIATFLKTRNVCFVKHFQKRKIITIYYCCEMLGLCDFNFYDANFT